MKTVFILLIFILLYFVSDAQTAIKKDCISTGGAITVSGSKKMIMTVGELATGERDAGTLHLSEGFINPDIQLITGTDETYRNMAGVSVYPNPAKNFVFIEGKTVGEYELYVFDNSSKLVLQKKLNNLQSVQIDISGFPSGEYLLIIKDESKKEYKSFRIIKLK